MGNWIVILICVFAAILFILACWYLPMKLTRDAGIDDPEKLAKLQDSNRKTVAQIAGGAALVLAFSWTFLKDQQTLDLSRTQTVNQQFAEAAKLLANGADAKSSTAEGRAAAIYSLESIVNSRAEYYAPVVYTLLSLIHERQSSVRYPEGARPPHVTNDVKAAIYVIGRFPRLKNRPLDFRELHLVGGSFSSSDTFEDANFRGAKLFATDFTGAKLVNAKFEGSQMSDWEAYGWKMPDGFTDELANSKNWKEFMRFRYITFFDGADLSHAQFNQVYVNGVSFQKADLSDANFKEANVGRADFSGAKNLQAAHFDNACYDEPFKPLGLSDAIIKKMKVRPTCR